MVFARYGRLDLAFSTPSVLFYPILTVVGCAPDGFSGASPTDRPYGAIRAGLAESHPITRGPLPRAGRSGRHPLRYPQHTKEITAPQRRKLTGAVAPSQQRRRDVR